MLLTAIWGKWTDNVIANDHVTEFELNTVCMWLSYNHSNRHAYSYKTYAAIITRAPNDDTSVS